MTKLFTTVHLNLGSKTIHSIGLPPELTEGKDLRKPFPVPDILIIEEDPKDTKGFFLYRYTKSKEFCGDTWHKDIQEAKDQAKFEYGDAIGKWQEISGDQDSLAYATSKLKPL